MARNGIVGDAESTRLRSMGFVDALLDCLALAMQDGKSSASRQRVMEQWLAAAGAQAASSPEPAPLQQGMHEGYTLCAEWAAQGLPHDILATRILQHIFAVWPHERADYQRRYDAYLEKELQNPRAPYYAGSRVWTAEVDNLRTRVNCAELAGEAVAERLLRRAVKLLHTHSERLPAPCTSPALVAGPGRTMRPAGALEELASHSAPEHE